jgi:hypothetical protein
VCDLFVPSIQKQQKNFSVSLLAANKLRVTQDEGRISNQIPFFVHEIRSKLISRYSFPLSEDKRNIYVLKIDSFMPQSKRSNRISCCEIVCLISISMETIKEKIYLSFVTVIIRAFINPRQHSIPLPSRLIKHPEKISLFIDVLLVL